MTGQFGSVDVFTRSPIRILVDLVFTPMGALLFLGLAVFLAITLGPLGLIGSAVFGFFGLFMLFASVVTMRRGVRRAVAEVGPEGLWTPDLPRRLAWSEIDHLELEDAVGTAGDLVIYRRLGIWPRDPALATRARGRRGLRMARGFTQVVNTMYPGPGLSDPARMAPFGIQAYDLEQDFGELVRSVEQYTKVVGVERGAEDAAPTRLVAPAPPLEGLAGAITANIGRQAGSLPEEEPGKAGPLSGD